MMIKLAAFNPVSCRPRILRKSNNLSILDFRFEFKDKKSAQAFYLNFHKYDLGKNLMYKNKKAMNGMDFSVHLIMKESTFEGHANLHKKEARRLREMQFYMDAAADIESYER